MTKISKNHLRIVLMGQKQKRGFRLALILAASTIIVQLVACMPTLTPMPLSPADNPIPSAIAPSVPTATSLADEKVQARAWVSNSRPGWGSVQTIYAQLTQGEQGVADAEMYCIVRDQDAGRRWPSEGFEITDEDGIASASFIVAENPEGALVLIDVYLVHSGRTYQTNASFVSHC